MTRGEQRAAEVAMGGEGKHTASVQSRAREATSRQTLASGRVWAAVVQRGGSDGVCKSRGVPEAIGGQGASVSPGWSKFGFRP